jgi:hypothetical protein
MSIPNPKVQTNLFVFIESWVELFTESGFALRNTENMFNWFRDFGAQKLGGKFSFATCTYVLASPKPISF